MEEEPFDSVEEPKRCISRDGSRQIWAMLHARFFHGGYLAGRLKEGQKLVLHGKVDRDPYRPGAPRDGKPPDRNRRERMTASQTDSTEVGRIVPIYEAMGGISSRMLRRIIYNALLNFDGKVPDPLPADIRERLRFPTRREALLYAHFPHEGCESRRAEQLPQPAAYPPDFRRIFLLSVRHRAAAPKARIASAELPCASAKLEFGPR